MRYTRTAYSSVLAMVLALGAAPALAADDSSGQQGAVRADLSGHTSAAFPGDERWLWEDRPACPPGERAVWVDRAGSPPKLYFDPRTGRITFEPGEPEFHG